MTATATDRRHARAVETAIETRVVLDEEQRLDRAEDIARAKANRATRALLCSLREESELDKLGDAQRARAIALVTELAGILDGVEQLPLIALEERVSA